MFRIMVLRDPDVLPTNDVALRRAIFQAYGVDDCDRVARLSKNWQPFRSVARWYLLANTRKRTARVRHTGMLTSAIVPVGLNLCCGYRGEMEYSRDSAFLNLLPDSRLR